MVSRVGRAGAEQQPRRRRWAYALLLLPIASIVYPPLYDHRDPALGGIPFFVWYQFVAVVFGGLVTGIVYLLLGAERSSTR